MELSGIFSLVAYFSSVFKIYFDAQEPYIPFWKWNISSPGETTPVSNTCEWHIQYVSTIDFCGWYFICLRDHLNPQETRPHWPAKWRGCSAWIEAAYDTLKSDVWSSEAGFQGPSQFSTPGVNVPCAEKRAGEEHPERTGGAQPGAAQSFLI